MPPFLLFFVLLTLLTPPGGVAILPSVPVEQQANSFTTTVLNETE